MNTLLSIYHSYFNSVMTYGLTFWGNSLHAEMVFKLQKRVIRLIKGYGYRNFCREHFRDMNILPLRSQYIYPLMMFVITNRKIFNTNSVWGKAHKTIFKDVFTLPSQTATILFRATVRNGLFQGRSTSDRPLTNQKPATALFRVARRTGR
jgi:hypothetical protein